MSVEPEVLANHRRCVLNLCGSENGDLFMNDSYMSFLTVEGAVLISDTDVRDSTSLDGPESL